MKNHIVIIGGGPGGYTAALEAAAAGAEVTLVEKEKIGGVCLNAGCIPSKVMKNSADYLAAIRRGGLGFQGTANIKIDLEELFARKEQVVGDLVQGIERQLAGAGVRLLAGEGRIKGEGCLEVNPAEGRVFDLSWGKLIIASGSAPAALPNMPFGGSVLSSTDLLNLRQLPPSMIVIGGGVIGCEFASIFRALGTEVTVVEGMPSILPIPGVDDDCRKVLVRQMKKDGIRLLTGRSVVGMGANGEDEVEIRIAVEQETNKQPEIEVLRPSCVLVSVGRRPTCDSLGLDNLGIARDSRGWITVNHSMQTSHLEVYAIGDVLGPKRPMLAHVAAREGRVAVENCLGGRVRMDYGFVPSAIFCRPEIGCTGLTEQEALELGHEIKVGKVLFRSCGKAHAIGEIDGLVKIIAAKDSGKIIGVHIIGPHASDLIGEGVLAAQNGLSAKDLANTIHAHPTLSEVLVEAASEVF